MDVFYIFQNTATISVFPERGCTKKFKDLHLNLHSGFLVIKKLLISRIQRRADSFGKVY